MKKESVILDYRAINAAPASHRIHVEERNSTIGRMVAANIFEIPFRGIGEPTRDTYALHGKPLKPQRAQKLAIVDASDLYGAAIAHPAQIHKAVMHPSVSKRYTPAFHSGDFAQELTKNNCVLPGVTAFQTQDLFTWLAQQDLNDQRYRLKVPNGSDGEGQVGGIDSLDKLQEGIGEIGTRGIKNHGLILEQEVTDPQTRSFGSIVLGDNIYSFYLTQMDEVIIENGKRRTRYLGAKDVVVTRGTLDDIKLPKESLEEKAREKAALFSKLHQAYFPSTLSRWSMDVVMNDDIAGVTDLTTGRIGGTDPALILAIQELKNDSSLTTVTADVVLDYGKVKDVPGNAVLFVNQPDLRLFAYITGKTGEFRLQ